MEEKKSHSKIGKFSRSKGRREEQQLVLYLANLGFKAERILRQYQAAGQPDVKAKYEDGDQEWTFENKSRKCSFKSIYALYANEKDGDGVLRFVTHSAGTPVAMSSKLMDLFLTDVPFRNLTLFPPDKKLVKVYNRLVAMKELKQSADFLVIKDNGKPRLFIRYW